MRRELKLSLILVAVNAALFVAYGALAAAPPFHLVAAALGAVQVGILFLLLRGSGAAHRLMVGLSFLTAVYGGLMVVASLASAAVLAAVLYAAVAAFDGYLLRALMACGEDVDWIARQRLLGAAEQMASEPAAS